MSTRRRAPLPLALFLGLLIAALASPALSLATAGGS
jgi:hypothetical protein